MYQQSGIYHVYNRGWNRGEIFFTERNYRFLIQKMECSREDFGIEMIAYCLMPNHYHFLLRQKSEKPVSRWLQVLFNGYSQAINRQEDRRGTLFEGRPKHVMLESDTHPVRLICYIHFNPVHAGLVQTPNEWKFSNALEWSGLRHTKLISENFISSFLSREDYAVFMGRYSHEKTQLLLSRVNLEGA